MNKIKRSLYCMLWVFALGACNSQPEVKSISFDLNGEVQDIHQTDLFSGFQIIPLETRDSVLIGDIDKVVVWNDRIFVAGYWDIKTVYAFDLKGHFLGQVGKPGRGAGEYLQLFDLFVDPRTERLNLVSRIDQKLFEYDVNDFHLIRIRHLPKAFKQIIPWQDGFVGYMANYSQDRNEPYNLWRLDSSLKIVDNAMPIVTGWESISTSMQEISSYQNSLYYIAPTDFNIYRYANDTVEIDHRVDFGKAHLPEEQISHDRLHELNPWSITYVSSIDIFQELPDYHIYQITHNGQNRLCLFHKQSGKEMVCELTTYDKDYFVPFGHPINITSEHFITFVEAARIHEILKGTNGYVNFEEKYPAQIQRMREILPDIAEDDNPCIILWKF